MYHSRNRIYDPDLGRFTSSDPFGMGLPALNDLAFGGEALGPLATDFDLRAHYGDGMNVHGAYGSNPLSGTDAMGLDWSLAGQIAMLGINSYIDANGTLQEAMDGVTFVLSFSLFLQDASILQMGDVEWSLDWSQSDDYLLESSFSETSQDQSPFDEFFSGPSNQNLAVAGMSGIGAKSTARIARQSTKRADFYARVAKAKKFLVPQKAKDTLSHIKSKGSPPPGTSGGRTYHNTNRRLPNGQYQEYDVYPHGGGNRGTERIVIEKNTGRAYYTPDHYGTFIPIN